MWGDYAVESICKQYIFHRAVLLNTEIIITITPRPLIKSSRTVRTYGRQFSQSQSERFCTKTQGLKCASIQKIFQTVKCGYKKQDFCMNLWRASQPWLHTQRRSQSNNCLYRLNNNSGGVSNGHLKETSICDNHFAALSGNGKNDQKIVFITGFLTRI